MQGGIIERLGGDVWRQESTAEVRDKANVRMDSESLIAERKFQVSLVFQHRFPPLPTNCKEGSRRPTVHRRGVANDLYDYYDLTSFPKSPSSYSSLVAARSATFLGRCVVHESMSVYPFVQWVWSSILLSCTALRSGLEPGFFLSFSLISLATTRPDRA